MIIIVWGKPVDFSGCSRIEELENGKDCIDYCEDNVNCILAHITSSDCYNCEGEGMVESLTSSENQKIAFKTNSTTCSKTEFIDYYYNDYTMKYQNDGGYWNVVKNEVPWECEGEWKIFERALGFWCVKLFYIEEKVNVTNTTSNQFCESKDSTLSALEDMNMTNWVKETAWSYSDGSTSQYILTDGMCTYYCSGQLSVVPEPECQFPRSYSWYDEMYLNTTSYNWKTDQPYALCRDDVCEQCIFLMSKKGDEIDGQTLLRRCDVEISMILCGKKATPI